MTAAVDCRLPAPLRQPTAAATWSGLPGAADAGRWMRLLNERPPLRRRAGRQEPVVLYGAGELGQLASAWCRQAGLTVVAVVDATAERWQGHPAWRGTDVRHPSEVPAAWLDLHPLLVCISTLPYAPLESGLLGQGWRRVQPFYDFVDAWPVPQPMNNGWQAPLPRGAAAEALAEVLWGWADDASRAHHLQFLAWRCRREEWRFDAAPVRPQERYFTPEMAAAFRPGERILDAGAYHGQVLSRWMAMFPGWLAQAWAVEPDPANHAVLRRWWSELAGHDRQRIELQAVALARRSARRAFVSDQGYGSRLWARGSQALDVRSIDGLGLHPSYVKLHLEGGEWRALQGATRTLAQSRPLLALTVYHRRDGLWPTAHWLMRQLPDYRWRFRLHGWLGTAAVVYGIPAERSAPPPA